MAARVRAPVSSRELGDPGDGMETMSKAANRAKRAAQSVKLLVVLCSLFALRCRAEASQGQLKEGNRQFKNGHYEDALKLYEDALVDTPYSSILQFNAGDAQYQMGDFSQIRNILYGIRQILQSAFKRREQLQSGKRSFPRGTLGRCCRSV